MAEAGGRHPSLCFVREGVLSCSSGRRPAAFFCPEGALFCCIRRRRLRGGAKFRWRVAAEGAFSVLRRAVCCVDAGPAGRCGRFSCFAHAPLIKKSGQKRNHGLLLLALSSGWSVSGARASAALRAVSAGGRGRKESFGCVGKVLGMDFGGWVCGACAVRWGFGGMLPRRALPSRCAARDTGGCAAGRSFAGVLHRRVLLPLYAARFAALTRPAGRCGRFSCFAHAPLIKKSGQKRNHGLLRPAIPSSSST